jgi:hypothetical protein
MQKFYADAFIAGTPKVLGLDLQPLTLGHAFILLAIDSPYITDKPGASVGDLLAAVWICSREWTCARKSLIDDTFKRDCLEWSNNHADLSASEESVKAFSDYRETYLQTAPRYDEVIKNGQPISANRKSARVPWPLALAWLLMTKMSEAEAWNTPTVRAFAYSAADSMFDESLIVDDGEETPDGNG